MRFGKSLKSIDGITRIYFVTRKSFSFQQKFVNKILSGYLYFINFKSYNDFKVHIEKVGI